MLDRARANEFGEHQRRYLCEERLRFFQTTLEFHAVQSSLSLPYTRSSLQACDGVGSRPLPKGKSGLILD